VRSGFQNFGNPSPNTAQGFGHIIATRVPWVSGSTVTALCC